MALFGFKKEKKEKAEAVEENRAAKAAAPETKQSTPKAKTGKAGSPLGAGAPGKPEQSTKRTVLGKKVSERKAAAQSGGASSTDHTSILIRPRITEKATFATERGAYVFDVASTATKTQIAEAVRHYYKVKPRQVNVVTVPAKRIRSRIRGRFGTVSGSKKAYVYLKEGDSIEIV